MTRLSYLILYSTTEYIGNNFSVKIFVASVVKSSFILQQKVLYNSYDSNMQGTGRQLKAMPR
jgi:hypothetical protein